MKRVDTLDLARDQLVLSILIRGVFSGRAGTFQTSLAGVSKGPWSFGTEEIESLDKDRAAWGLEMIATQNLAIALDTALEIKIPNRLRYPEPRARDYFCFVRCLRNAFAHDPYRPRWDLRIVSYRKEFHLPGEWTVDLSERNGTDVEPADYRYAGGLVRLCDAGKSLLAATGGGA